MWNNKERKKERMNATANDTVLWTTTTTAAATAAAVERVCCACGSLMRSSHLTRDILFLSFFLSLFSLRSHVRFCCLFFFQWPMPLMRRALRVDSTLYTHPRSLNSTTCCSSTYLSSIFFFHSFFLLLLLRGCTFLYKKAVSFCYPPCVCT